MTQGTPQAISAARFVVSFDGAAPAYFSELSGITSEVEPTEYIVSPARGGDVIHTKQFGKTKPPTVTLKRGVDGTAFLFAWHAMARKGDPGARMSGTLELQNAAGVAQASYRLLGAWPSKVEVGNLKAGASEIVLETVTFTCEEVIPV
ncbi:T4-like virus tail tube protein gp19 [Streptomyces sp. ADI96-02]|uniref:phage tail protein n=1 Tax=unclassified Streptomyces TaxID=2593676 RepID=UPI000F552A73|nr:phage tail protein [Streptomyces sp. ADI96-02]RPK67635.1 T4-like virus tail tube protein gp19 [Streptomyces sp. ADI96-02]